MAASGNRRSTTKKKPAARSAYQKRSQEKATQELLKKEVCIWIALALGIVLELCNFGIGKDVGNVVSAVFFGICGLFNYAFPLFLIFAVVFLAANKGKGIAYLKFAFLIIASFMVCTFIQLVSGPFDEGVGYLDYYSMSAKGRNGGGIIGGTFAKLLCTPLGKPIAFVIVIIVFIICIVIVSEKSIFKGIKNGGEKAITKARDNAEIRSEKQRLLREERRSQREIDRAKEAEAIKERERQRDEERKREEAIRAEEERRIREERIREEVRSENEKVLSSEKTNPSINASLGNAALGNSSARNSISLMDTELVKKPLDMESEMACLKEARDKVTGSIDLPLESKKENPAPDVILDNFIKEIDGEAPQAEKTYRLDFPWLKDDKDMSSEEKTGDQDLFNTTPLDTGFYGEEEAALREKQRRENAIVNLSGNDYYDIRGYIEPGQFVVNNSASEKKTEGFDNRRNNSNIEKATSEVKSSSSGKSLKNTDSIKITSISDEDETIEAITVSPERKKRITRETRQETMEAMAQVDREINSVNTEVAEYLFPPVELLKSSKRSSKNQNTRTLQETADKLVSTLESFGVRTHIINVSCGPSVTRYELAPETGVKVSRIVSLSDDIKLNLAASDIRIEAPIPGKAAVGIEVPNKDNSTVTLRELIESEEFINHKSKIAFAVGLDLSGRTVITDIFKMPHLLIGGATGSGKSVCINTLIISILYKAKPDEVKFIMIDPKMIELNLYNGIPHLYIPVVTDPKKAAGALQWAVAEMTKRYTLFSALGVRDLKGYNAKIETVGPDENGVPYKKLPQIVIVVDEFADLMMVASGEVEEAVCRLAQLARAAGIHLILATQRPSVDVITGLIKANMPSRLALAVSSGVDSRTIIDMVGAEKLLGKGDMLFYPSGLPKPIRVQGAYVTEQEVEKVVEFVKNQNGDAAYDEAVASQIEAHARAHDNNNKKQAAEPITGEDEDGRDPYFKDAARFIVEKEKASIGSLQRVFKIGFNRAARIMDQLCEAGIVGEEEGTKPRRILMNLAQLEEFFDPRMESDTDREDTKGEEECTV